MKNKILTTFLCIMLAVFLGVFLFFGYKLYSTMHGYETAKKEYDSMSNQYTSSNLNRTEIKKEEEKEEEKKPLEFSPIDVDFDSLKAISSDVIGWIFMPDTVINYPVVKGLDNDYYLHRLFDGSSNANGTIFMDFTGNVDFSMRNNILYGHHMNDGSMFASLTDYTKPGYYEEHPIFYINTPEVDYKLEIFSAYITPFDSESYTYMFEDEMAYDNYLKQIQQWSMIDTDVVVTDSDRIVTLSTCTYEFENARFVVHAKMVPIGYNKLTGEVAE